MSLIAAPLRAAPPRTVVAELVGPAGAGKTALLRALARHDAGVRAGAHIDRWRDLPTVLRQAALLAPIGIELIRRRPRAFRSAMGQLIRLRTLPVVLEREARTARGAMVLDEGPLFALGRLCVSQEADRGKDRLAQEWQTQLEDWAARLDLVIWLDAPDHLLMERIRSRPKTHRVKAGTDDVIVAFLHRYRRAYETIRARIATTGHARQVDIDTSAVSSDQASELVLAALQPGRDA